MIIMNTTDNKEVKDFMCTLKCSTVGSCPFSFTEQSEIAQNYGCLPSPYEIVRMRKEFGKTWACHQDPTKPCLGAIQYMKEKGLEHKIIDKQLVTIDDWNSL